MTADQVEKISLSTPVFCQITIGGVLDKSWAIELEMTLTYPEDVQNNPVTILRGQLADQAALFGVLLRLYGMGFPLISVKSVVSGNCQG
jgi:hypothetical protein